MLIISLRICRNTKLKHTRNIRDCNNCSGGNSDNYNDATTTTTTNYNNNNNDNNNNNNINNHNINDNTIIIIIITTTKPTTTIVVIIMFNIKTTSLRLHPSPFSLQPSERESPSVLPLQVMSPGLIT